MTKIKFKIDNHPSGLKLIDLHAEWPKLQAVIDSSPEYITGLIDELEICYEDDISEFQPWKCGSSYHDNHACEAMKKCDIAQQEVNKLGIKYGLHLMDDGQLTGFFESDDPGSPSDKYYDEEDKIRDRFYPQPNTPEFYHVPNRCHNVVKFLCTIAQQTYPEFFWIPAVSDKHSTALGISPITGKPTIILDSVWYLIDDFDDIIETAITAIERNESVKNVCEFFCESLAGISFEQLNKSALKKNKSLEKRANELKQQAYKLAGEEFDLKSSQEIQQILFEKLEISGNRMISDFLLKELAVNNELASVIVEYRTLLR